MNFAGIFCPVHFDLKAVKLWGKWSVLHKAMICNGVCSMLSTRKAPKVFLKYRLMRKRGNGVKREPVFERAMQEEHVGCDGL